MYSESNFDKASCLRRHFLKSRIVPPRLSVRLYISVQFYNRRKKFFSSKFMIRKLTTKVTKQWPYLGSDSNGPYFDPRVIIHIENKTNLFKQTFLLVIWSYETVTIAFTSIFKRVLELGVILLKLIRCSCISRSVRRRY